MQIKKNDFQRLLRSKENIHKINTLAQSYRVAWYLDPTVASF